MTCITGMIDKEGKGHIACDSVGSNGWTKNTYKNKKIFRKGNLLIGYTSSYRMGQLLEHQLTMPRRGIEQELDEWIYVDFVNAVRQLLKDNGYMRIDSNQESVGTFMLIANGRLFVMHDDLAILENKEGFDSVGSGESHAVGAMHVLINHTELKPRVILTQAIEVASTYVATVGGDIHYLGE